MRLELAWQTTDELNYIDRLAGFGDHGKQLSGYYLGALQRSEWAGMERQRVLGYARTKLNRLGVTPPTLQSISNAESAQSACEPGQLA